MAINVIVQDKGGFLSDILRLTKAPILVWFDGTIILYYYCPLNYVLLQSLMFCYVWRLCMAIDISVQQYNGGLLPDSITVGFSPTLYC